jgi:hypothetical protein
MPITTSNNLTGCAGEYSVCAELCRHGLLALITPKNNPLFDVVATNPEGSDSVAIQVKTKSIKNKQGWKLGKDIETPQHNEDLFVVLADLRPDGSTEFYIYEYDVLSKRIRDFYANYMRTPKKDGGQRKEVGFRWFDLKYFTDDDKDRKNKWDLIENKLKKA